jgi:hypothetical protein
MNYDGKSVPTKIDKHNGRDVEICGVRPIQKVGVPNGDRQTTERPLSFTIDLHVVAA